jgi:hypothetical protein
MPSVAEKLINRYVAADVAIKATEDWAAKYHENEKVFAALLKNQSKFELAMRRHLRDVSKTKIDQLVNWPAYAMLSVKQGADKKTIPEVEIAGQLVVVTADSIVYINEKALLLAILEEYILNGVALGAEAAQAEYVDLGWSATTEAVQKAALEHSAELVGKTIGPDGTLIDNPKATYSITNTMRDDIKQSISTSLSLGENVDQATKRVAKTIDNPSRAATIARTESRNSYVRGADLVAHTSGAITWKWDPSGSPCEICEENVNDGVISIDEDFTNGLYPHPNCLCGDPIYGYPSGDGSTLDIEDNED